MGQGAPLSNASRYKSLVPGWSTNNYDTFIEQTFSCFQ